MAHNMIATFSDEAYAALMSGIAVDNNGLRYTNGRYYPDQPTFSEMIQYPNQPTISENNQLQSPLKQVGVTFLVAACGYTTFEILLPELQRFTHEKIYPYFAEKWDNWRAGKTKCNEAEQATPASKENNHQENDVSSDKTKTINLENYRRNA